MRCRKSMPRRTESTVSPGRPRIRSTCTLIPSANNSLHAVLEGRQVRGPAHQFPRPRLDRLQTDLDLMEVGLAEQPGRFGVDPFRPQFAGERQLPPGVVAGKQPQEVGKIGPLVERRIQQHDFPRPAARRAWFRLAEICSAERNRGTSQLFG